MSMERRTFPDRAEYRLLLKVLLTQDGSTTRICEVLSGTPVNVIVHRQVRTNEVPGAVRRQLGGERWLERVTSLCSDAGVLMDNLSYTRLDTVPDGFLGELDQGVAPIGHLLKRLYVRRVPAQADADVEARLWDVVGLPDATASRAYRILAPQGPFIYIFETFRGGLVRA
ncbi:MAG: DUF98 domain-containing protein [Betaproteobacteria bacterium]|nr:DUF98 domain-containing protein [Betaproteobacteria bacterium]